MRYTVLAALSTFGLLKWEGNTLVTNLFFAVCSLRLAVFGTAQTFF